MSGRLYEKISKSSGSNLAGLLSGNTGDLGALLAMAGPGLASVHTTTSKTSTDDENYDSGVDYEESSFVSNDHFESIMELYESMFRDGESVNQTSASSELNGRVFLQAWYISMQRYGREKGKLHSKPLTAAQFDLYMESIEVPYSNVLEFTYPIKNEKFCSATPDSEIVIMVVSKVKNLPQRNAIRKTWAAAAPPAVKVLFFLSDNTRYRTAIHQESKKYSDLVSVDVPQTYEYAARKSLAALDWPIRFCNKTRYIFETTDGVYVNASILVGQARFASEAEPAGKPVIIGRLVRNTSVPRIPLKLEYLFYDEYPFDVFPTYLKGFGLLMNMDFAKQAVAAGKDFPLLRTGDFLISGILAAKLKTTPHSFQKHGVASVRGEDIAEGHVSGLCEKKESVVFGERLTAPAMLMIDATLRTC